MNLSFSDNQVFTDEVETPIQLSTEVLGEILIASALLGLWIAAVVKELNTKSLTWHEHLTKCKENDTKVRDAYRKFSPEDRDKFMKMRRNTVHPSGYKYVELCRYLVESCTESRRLINLAKDGKLTGKHLDSAFSSHKIMREAEVGKLRGILRINESFADYHYTFEQCIQGYESLSKCIPICLGICADLTAAEDKIKSVAQEKALSDVDEVTKKEVMRYAKGLTNDLVYAVIVNVNFVEDFTKQFQSAILHVK